MAEAKEKVFGLNEIVSTEDARSYVDFLLNMIKFGNESECNIDA